MEKVGGDERVFTFINLAKAVVVNVIYVRILLLFY